MDKMKYFDDAVINISKGALVVNATVFSYHNCYDKVTVRQTSPGEYMVKGWLRRYKYFDISRKEGHKPEVIEQFTDESIKTKKVWSWKHFKQISIRYLDGWCEYKKQKQYIFTTTNLIVIE